MKPSARLVLACVSTSLVLAGPAAAQTQGPLPGQAAPGKPAPTKPAPVAPDKPAPVTPSGPRLSALKLAGLVTFVANSCPDLKPDYVRFDQAIHALGVSTADLAQPEMKGAYLAYTARYNADVKTSCARAKAQFGPGGTTLPDIFEPR